MMAVLFAIVQPADAPPDDLSLPSGRPCAAAIGRAAFTADQQLRQRVLAGIVALLGFGADLLDFLCESCLVIFWLGKMCEFTAEKVRKMCLPIFQLWKDRWTL